MRKAVAMATFIMCFMPGTGSAQQVKSPFVGVAKSGNATGGAGNVVVVRASDAPGTPAGGPFAYVITQVCFRADPGTGAPPDSVLRVVTPARVLVTIPFFGPPCVDLNPGIVVPRGQDVVAVTALGSLTVNGIVTREASSPSP